MTTGGMEYGEDFVSARLNFDVPVEGLQSLREINVELERFRTNTEAFARGGDDFGRYVRGLAEAEERAIQITRTLNTQLEHLVSAQERMGSSSQFSTAIPQGYTAPFQGEAAGTGAGRDIGRIPTTIPSGASGGFSPTMLDNLASSDPRAYLNARTAWGGNKAGDIPTVSISADTLDQLAQRLADRDKEQANQEKRNPPARATPRPSSHAPAAPWENWRNRMGQWSGTAGKAMNAFSGGGLGSLLGMAGQGMSHWSAHTAHEGDGTGAGREGVPAPPGPGSPAPGVPGMPEEGAPPGGGGGVMDAMKSAGGWGGAGLAVGLGGLSLFEKAGQQVQQYRALGQIRGGGFGEGMGYEMQARVMALNPFITNDQARQIMQSALTQGFTGKEYETVTAFMANNLKDMNISVADSTAQLQASTKGSTESIGALRENLDKTNAAMKDLSKGSNYGSLPDRQKTAQTIMGAASEAGGGGPESYAFGAQIANAFTGHAGEMKIATEAGVAASNSLPFQLMMRAHGGPGGGALDVSSLPGYNPADPGSIFEALINAKGTRAADAFWNTLKFFADTARGNVQTFQLMLQANGMPLSRKDAEVLMKAAQAAGTGGKGDPLVADKQQQDKADSEHPDESSPSTGDRLKNDAKIVLGLNQPTLALRGGKWLAGKLGLQNPFSHPSAALNDSTIKDRVLGVYGASAEVGSGDNWAAFNPDDEEQMKGLRSGKLHVRGSGESGGGVNVSDISKEGDHTGTGQGRSGGKPGPHLSGQLNIVVKPESMRTALGVPSYVPLTQNEQQANAGYSTSTKNNPPPGDGVTVRGSR